MRTNWWGGTWLVARRALAEGFASRSWRIVTALMLAGGLAVVVIPRVLSDQGTRYTLASVGPAPEAERAQLDAAGKAADFTVDYKALPDVAAVRDAVREGQVDAGLSRAGTDARIYVQRPDAGIYGVLSAALSAQAAASAMEQAGLTPSQIAQLQDIPLPEQVIRRSGPRPGPCWYRLRRGNAPPASGVRRRARGRRAARPPAGGRSPARAQQHTRHAPPRGGTARWPRCPRASARCARPSSR